MKGCFLRPSKSSFPFSEFQFPPTNNFLINCAYFEIKAMLQFSDMKFFYTLVINNLRKLLLSYDLKYLAPTETVYGLKVTFCVFYYANNF